MMPASVVELAFLGMVPVEKILVIEVLIAFALLLGLVVALEIGFRGGRRAVREREAPSIPQLGAIQGATLGLLGLLLGFSFAGAATRYMDRQHLIVREANAIGTAYLRADLLDDDRAAQVREILEEYLQHRVEVAPRMILGLTRDDRAAVAGFHDRLWRTAADGVRDSPGQMVAVLNPMNEVIDLHGERIAAARRHLPGLVMGLLMVCSLLAVGAIGYGCGTSKRRCIPMTGALTILIAITLWTIIDLDYPRAGIIKLSDRPLAELELGRAE